MIYLFFRYSIINSFTGRNMFQGCSLVQPISRSWSTDWMTKSIRQPKDLDLPRRQPMGGQRKTDALIVNYIRTYANSCKTKFQWMLTRIYLTLDFIKDIIFLIIDFIKGQSRCCSEVSAHAICNSSGKIVQWNRWRQDPVVSTIARNSLFIGLGSLYTWTWAVSGFVSLAKPLPVAPCNYKYIVINNYLGNGKSSNSVQIKSIIIINIEWAQCLKDGFKF